MAPLTLNELWRPWVNQLTAAPSVSWGHSYLFFHWWGLNVHKCSESESSVLDTCMPFPCFPDSCCQLCSVWNVQIHSTPAPREPKRSFPPVCSTPWFQWFSRTLFFFPHAYKNLISMRRSGRCPSTLQQEPRVVQKALGALWCFSQWQTKWTRDKLSFACFKNSVIN